MSSSGFPIKKKEKSGHHQLETSSKLLMISIYILTYNEEIDIAPCLDSAMLSDDVIVVDSFSTDKTKDLSLRLPFRPLLRWIYMYFIAGNNRISSQKSWFSPNAVWRPPLLRSNRLRPATQ